MAKAPHLVAMVGSDTVIGTGVEVEGALGSAGDITIDGNVNGDVTAGGNITVGVNGQVTGNLSGINIVIAGQIKGSVVASGETHLTETSKLIGDITTQLIAIDSGANFLGTIHMQEQQRLLPNDDNE